MAEPEPTIRYVERSGAPVLKVGGTWTVFSLHDLRKRLDKARREAQGGGRAKANTVDATDLKRLDTAGALEILQLAGGPDAEIKTAEQSHADLFKVVKQSMCVPPKPRHVDFLSHWLEELGRDLVGLGKQLANLCAFIGEIIVVFLEACVNPKRFRIGAVVRQMFEVWVKALLIVGVLCFLIGVVIAYQGVQQLRQFGAETFTVEAVGIGMFRELGVLLTAIIVAGRSGSAFTAQIGTMKVNQEIDAMQTIGLNPIASTMLT